MYEDEPKSKRSSAWSMIVVATGMPIHRCALFLLLTVIVCGHLGATPGDIWMHMICVLSVRRFWLEWCY